jgi:hypothetical protein
MGRSSQAQPQLNWGICASTVIQQRSLTVMSGTKEIDEVVIDRVRHVVIAAAGIRSRFRSCFDRCHEHDLAQARDLTREMACSTVTDFKGLQSGTDDQRRENQFSFGTNCTGSDQ